MSRRIGAPKIVVDGNHRHGYGLDMTTPTNPTTRPVHLLIPAICSTYRSPRVVLQTVHADRRVELSAPMTPSQGRAALRAARG